MTMFLTRNTPWGNNLDIRFKAIEREFESDLVISFASAAVGDETSRLHQYE